MASGSPFSLLDDTLHGTINQKVVTVSGTPPTALHVGGSIQQERKFLYVQNNGNASVYVGGSNVTASNGFEIKTGSTEKFPLGRAEMYAIASGIVNVRIVEFS